MQVIEVSPAKPKKLRRRYFGCEECGEIISPESAKVEHNAKTGHHCWEATGLWPWDRFELWLKWKLKRRKRVVLFFRCEVDGKIIREETLYKEHPGHKVYECFNPSMYVKASQWLKLKLQK